MSIVRNYPEQTHRRLPKRLPLLGEYPLYSLNAVAVTDAVTIPFAGFPVMTSITAECWIRSANTGISSHIFSRYGAVGQQFSLHQRNTGALSFYINGGGAGDRITSAVGLITTDKLLHLVGVFNGVTTNHQIYINAKSVGKRNYAVALNNPNVNIRIFDNAFAGGEGLLGRVMAPRIYNRELSLNEVEHNMYNPLNPIRTGLLFFAPLIAGSGINVQDYSGLGNNGTIGGAITWAKLQKYEIPGAEEV